MQYCVMDGDPHRMQYGQTTYPPGRAYAAAAAAAASIRGPSNLPSIDRYRQPHTHISSARSPTSIPGTTAGSQNQGFAGYSYAQGGQPYAPQLQGSSLPYQSDFSHDAQRPQQFPSYPSNLMYSLSSPVQQPSGFDSVQQYQPRQSAALDALTNQLGVPQYYNTAEPSSASSAPVPQTYSSAPYQQQQQQHQQQDVSPYQQSSQPTVARTTTESSPYATAMAGYTQQTSMTNALGQQQQQQQPRQQQQQQYQHQQSRSHSQPQQLQEQQQEGSQQGQGMTDEAYADYLDGLKQTFQDTYDGKLTRASHRLLEISDNLLGRANELGLTKDDQDFQAQRLELWNDFNTCWLALLQRQKDLTQAMVESGGALETPQEVLDEEALERMARELVRMCDELEPHGLVDYQMGVWEEEIMNVLLECLAILEGDFDDQGADATALPPIVDASSSR